jgi:hypothetical protein
VKPAIPHGNDEFVRWNGHGTCEVNGIGPAERVPLCEFAGMLFDLSSQLNRPRGRPELLPTPQRRLEADSIERAVPVRGGKRSADFGVGKPT